MSSLDDVSGGSCARPKGKVTRGDKRELPSYKYSNKGKGPLHEAVILNGRPLFLKYEDSKINLIDKIEEENRIIRPPYSEEYPYEPYEFVDIEEIQSLVKQTESASIDSLYMRAKEYVQEYNEQDYTSSQLISYFRIFRTNLQLRIT